MKPPIFSAILCLAASPFAEENPKTPKAEPKIMRTSQKFLAFEGLRGVLALCVCISHLGLYGALTSHGISFNFGMSVDVFFALSGFVLCYSNYFGRRTFDTFFVGRVARLWPLHFLTLLLMIVLYAFTNRTFSLWQEAQQILLIHNLGIRPNAYGLNFPSWSISVEFWTSLLFFPLLLNKKFWAAIPFGLLFICFFFVFPGYINLFDGNLYHYFNGGLLRGFAGFALGCSAFLIYDRVNDRLPASPVISYLALVAIAVCFFVRDLNLIYTVIFYAGLFTFLVFSPKSDEKNVLSSRIFVVLGAISYSIYLLHIPISEYCDAIFGAKTKGAGKIPVLVLILFASFYCHRYFEIPLQKRILKAYSNMVNLKNRVVRS